MDPSGIFYSSYFLLHKVHSVLSPRVQWECNNLFHALVTKYLSYLFFVFSPSYIPSQPSPTDTHFYLCCKKIVNWGIMVCPFVPMNCLAVINNEYIFTPLQLELAWCSFPSWKSLNSF